MIKLLWVIIFLLIATNAISMSFNIRYDSLSTDLVKAAKHLQRKNIKCKSVLSEYQTIIKKQLRAAPIIKKAAKVKRWVK